MKDSSKAALLENFNCLIILAVHVHAFTSYIALSITTLLKGIISVVILMARGVWQWFHYWMSNSAIQTIVSDVALYTSSVAAVPNLSGLANQQGGEGMVPCEWQMPTPYANGVASTCCSCEWSCARAPATCANGAASFCGLVPNGLQPSSGLWPGGWRPVLGNQILHIMGNLAQYA